MPAHDPLGGLDAFLSARADELVAFRRDLHAHPELGYHEHRTTRLVAAQLTAAGLRPAILPKGTGLVIDVGDRAGPVVALRADLDPLPVPPAPTVPHPSPLPHPHPP